MAPSLRILRASFVASATLTLAAACGPTSGSGDDGGGDGTIDAAGQVLDDGGLPVFPDAASCGQQTEPIELVNLGDPPDLLIVLDRSGSMNSPIPAFPPSFVSKWTIMRNALNSLVGARQNNIRFGLMHFPSDNNCGVSAGTIQVPVDLGQAPEVMSYFGGNSANGNTPAHLGLGSALTYYNSIPVNPEGRFVLFATDGEPNCAGGVPDASSATETVAAVTALASAGIKTYVLGFGGGFTDDSVLRNSAIAGGVPRAGNTPYYVANDAAQLDAVLSQIAGGLIIPSCSYALASPPPDPDLVAVSLNGNLVPRSTQHTDGWDYHPDANTITFFGSYCQQIMSGAVTEVSFAYG
ncbi:MAG: VWA domain-containing protein, partial [Kofleriaceae bacterium]|nr:VWA domain-containing protein [Kofleriaceae bacterium]